MTSNNATFVFAVMQGFAPNSSEHSWSYRLSHHSSTALPCLVRDHVIHQHRANFSSWCLCDRMRTLDATSLCASFGQYMPGARQPMRTSGNHIAPGNGLPWILSGVVWRWPGSQRMEG